MIVADSGAIYGLLNRKDHYHEQLKELFRHEPKIFVPTAILAEISYFLENHVGIKGLETFLRDVERGFFLLEGSEADIPRIRELAVKYADLRLGFADAAVIAVAERRGGRVATVDRRHFSVVKAKRRLKLLPEL